MTESEIVTMKEFIALQFDSLDRATKLQAKEYERRLDGLNGEAGRLSQMQSTYLPREVYEINHKELCNKVESLQNFRSNLEGRMIVIAFCISAIVSILFILLSYFLKV
jgi:hypothetical protein